MKPKSTRLIMEQQKERTTTSKCILKRSAVGRLKNVKDIIIKDSSTKLKVKVKNNDQLGNFSIRDLFSRMLRIFLMLFPGIEIHVLP
ncbi:hypothetical protein TNCT_215721 [Trichonephila clavata]|uniref:Uncharacterized protein n=1 Tax=Trichonephila clavata TaxID=2740835 RepID=A0A8X6KA19_TRICU|nr:hypothetical protein TNCT_215721 [Trichonephila clavata]